MTAKHTHTNTRTHTHTHIFRTALQPVSAALPRTTVVIPTLARTFGIVKLLHEDRRGLRVVPIDIPEESAMFDATRFADMDAFSEEERAWNPFYIHFYRPDDERQQLFNYRERLR